LDVVQVRADGLTDREGQRPLGKPTTHSKRQQARDCRVGAGGGGIMKWGKDVG
jgi:hypothetical protein